MESRVCRGSSFANVCLDEDEALNWSDSEIVDSLLVTEESQRERGRVEIDKSFTNRINQTLELSNCNFIQPGSLIQTVEGINISTGILRSISLSFIRNGNTLSVGSTLGVEHNV